MRSLIFAKRTAKEILRDPLSYIFCIGFPIVMLMIMTIVNESIPKEAGLTIFRIDNLAPGIAFFGLTFVMLFTALQVSKDRTTTFMTRLYATPMTSFDFIAGYTFAVLIIAAIQMIITFLASGVIAAVNGVEMNFVNICLCVVILLLTAVLFIALGILFGTLLNDKAAPGVCSIIISAAGMLGGVWMDLDSISGGFKKTCEILPFYPAVKAARHAISGEIGGIGKSLIWVFIYAVILYIIAVLIFKGKMKSDKK